MNVVAGCWMDFHITCTLCDTLNSSHLLMIGHEVVKLASVLHFCNDATHIPLLLCFLSISWAASCAACLLSLSSTLNVKVESIKDGSQVKYTPPQFAARMPPIATIVIRNSPPLLAKDRLPRSFC